MNDPTAEELARERSINAEHLEAFNRAWLTVPETIRARLVADNVTTDFLPAAIAALVRERDAAIEADEESDRVRDDMAQRLTAIANALKGPPPRNVSHSWHDLAELVSELRGRLDSRQAHIDALMLEYCPELMTDAQRASWAAHQRRVTPLDDE